MSNKARFINDASTRYANCITISKLDGEVVRLFVFTTKEIAKGCELRYNYAPNNPEECPWRLEVRDEIIICYFYGTQVD